MNWLKKLKLAFPIAELPTGTNYMDIGHYFPPENEITSMMWFIDKDLNLKTKKAKPGVSHGHWNDFVRTYEKNLLASGRYENKNGDKKISFLLNTGFYRLSPEEQIGYRKVIIQILDEEFGNPKIMQMN